MLQQQQRNAKHGKRSKQYEQVHVFPYLISTIPIASPARRSPSSTMTELQEDERADEPSQRHNNIVIRSQTIGQQLRHCSSSWLKPDTNTDRSREALMPFGLSIIHLLQHSVDVHLGRR